MNIKKQMNKNVHRFLKVKNKVNLMKHIAPLKSVFTWNSGKMFFPNSHHIYSNIHYVL